VKCDMNYYFMQTGIHSNWSVTHEPFEYPTFEEWKKRAKETGYNILIFAEKLTIENVLDVIIEGNVYMIGRKHV